MINADIIDTFAGEQSMVYHGRIKNGVIVLDESVRLPEGAEVRVDLISNGPSREEGEAIPSLYERYKSLIGIAKGLPQDASRNIDRDLYGNGKS